MSLPVLPRRVAQNEYDDALDHHNGRGAALGARFDAAVRQTFADVGANPYQFAEVYGNVREALVTGFKYAVYFRVLTDRVEVIAVFHTSRDPAVWQARA